MKLSRLIPAVVVSAGLLFNSCIREEAPNMEADIESVTIANAESLLQTEPVIESNNITFRMKTFSGSYKFAPEFKLSDGATISPASGTELDFTQPQTYTVTSEDGAWSRQYVVSFITDENAFITSYSFENMEEDATNKYHKFYEILNNQKLFNWSSGNDGFSLTNSGGTADTYPTLQVADGYSGKGVRMITRSTGFLGSMFGAPIAAGNLFLGTFSLNIANTLKSTRFGIPYNYNKAPKAVTGYFKYKAGATFTKKDRSSTLTKDTWNAYAILFEKSNTNNYITGDHNFADARIVSIAKLKDVDRKEANQWTRFEIPFELVSGKSFDPTKEYMYTIVFTSSIEGDKYNGAVGSTLDIDEVRIITE